MTGSASWLRFFLELFPELGFTHGRHLLSCGVFAWTTCAAWAVKSAFSIGHRQQLHLADPARSDVPHRVPHGNPPRVLEHPALFSQSCWEYLMKILLAHEIVHIIR